MKKSRSGGVLNGLTSKELSPSTWPDFVKLFEKHGGVWGGCWCMYYHTPGGWQKRIPEQNRREKERLVSQGRSHGVLVYHEDEPVGWCQFGTAEELPRIDRMRRYGRHDLEGLWRITCFFVDRDHRRMGVAREALRAALRVMEPKGVRAIEAYPIEAGARGYSSSNLWWGTVGLFEEFGFTEIGRLGKSQILVRKKL